MFTRLSGHNAAHGGLVCISFIHDRVENGMRASTVTCGMPACCTQSVSHMKHLTMPKSRKASLKEKGWVYFKPKPFFQDQGYVFHIRPSEE